MPTALLTRSAIVSPAWIDVQNLDEWLTEGEQARAESFASPVRRRDWLAGRLAAKSLLYETWHIAPRDATVGRDGLAPCIIVRGGGNPQSSPVNWSLSHSHGWGAACWADTVAEGTAGLDIQHIRAAHPRLAARILAPEEHAAHETLRAAHGDPAALLLIWALKEAAIKARRQPWGHALAAAQVRITSASTAQITIPDSPEPLAATFARHGEFWVARAVQSSPTLY